MKQDFQERTIPKSAENCKSNLVNSLNYQSAFSITNIINENNGYVIYLEKSFSLYSFGEFIIVTIKAINPQLSKVTIDSRLKSKLQQFDWDVNKKNVNKLFVYINTDETSIHNRNSDTVSLADKYIKSGSKRQSPKIEQRIAGASCEYCGGHEDLNKVSFGNLYVYNNKITFSTFIKPNFEIPIMSIIDSQILTQEQITQRPTLTRILLFGIFALGMQKQITNKSIYLTIKYVDCGIESTIIFRFNKNSFRNESDAVKINSAILKARKAQF